MKWWHKLSLMSLMVPVVTSISLVSVGCGNTVIISKPDLTNLITDVYSKEKDPQLWWGSISGKNATEKLLNQLSILNHLLNGESFGIHEVNSIEVINASTNPTSFYFHITLNDGFEFTDGKTEWDFGTKHINYHDTTNETPKMTAVDVDPTVKTETRKHISSSESDVNKWFDSLSSLQAKFNAFFNNSSNDPYKYIDSINDVSLIRINDVDLEDPNETIFSVQVSLKDTYYFSSNYTKTWISNNWIYTKS